MAIPFGIPAYAGMTVGAAGMTVGAAALATMVTLDSRLRGKDGRGRPERTVEAAGRTVAMCNCIVPTKAKAGYSHLSQPGISCY